MQRDPAHFASSSLQLSISSEVWPLSGKGTRQAGTTTSYPTWLPWSEIHQLLPNTTNEKLACHYTFSSPAFYCLQVDCWQKFQTFSPTIKLHNTIFLLVAGRILIWLHWWPSCQPLVCLLYRASVLLPSPTLSVLDGCQLLLKALPCASGERLGCGTVPMMHQICGHDSAGHKTVLFIGTWWGGGSSTNQQCITG